MSSFASVNKRTRYLQTFTQFVGTCLLVVLLLLTIKSASATEPGQSIVSDVAPAAGVLALETAAETAVQDAWERAQTSGTYQFTSDIVQTTTPVATALNAGRQGKVQTMYLEGNTNLSEQQLLLSLWNQGGSVQDAATAIQVRVEKDKAFIRRGTQPWQQIEDFTSFFAPNGDFMSYLVAAKNIRELGTESRAGLTYTRYVFELDGPGYAAYMRDQMESQLHASGELPPEMSLALSQQYVEMTGSGELWVTPDGWPLRQLIHMDLPAENESQVSAEITVNFSNFDKTAVTAVSPPPTARLAHQLAQLQTVDPIRPLTSLSIVLSMAAIVWLLLNAMRSRKLYAALNLLLIVTILSAPLIQGASAQQFSNRQIAKAAEREELNQKSNMEQALAAASEESTATAQEKFAALKADDGTDSDSDGYTDVEETLLGTNPLSSPLFIEARQALDPIPPKDSTDTDGDGLTDYEEYLVGTSPELDDSDSDGIADDAEVKGFSFNGQDWYTNPLLADSNEDGLNDIEEWGDLDSSSRPDMDGDKLPDLFDTDNDGDGVPDRVDISPYVYEANRAVYSDAAPLDLVVDNLTPNELTYVELQLRPTNPDHLWYAFNVLDWPSGDLQGSMQDVDGQTFSDYDSALDPLPNENGDIKLLPVLEITLPQTGNNLPDTQTLKDYNIDEPTSLPDPNDGQIIYVPLQVVTDPNSGEQVAFYAKIPYLPAAEWGAAHHIRLVWAVQALVDVCDEYGDSGECIHYAEYNKPSVIQSYPDDFELTGLVIRENIESKVATIYEDPAAGDSQVDDDNNLWMLMAGLDEFFLGAKAVTDGLDVGQRELTIDSIAQRFDHNTTPSLAARWGLDNVFTVVTHSYEHVDKAVFTQATEVNSQILSMAFPANSTPTLLFAREDTYRSLNLNEMQRGLAGRFKQDGQQLTIDVAPALSDPNDPTSGVPIETMATLKWSPYVYANGAWGDMAMDDYWDVLTQRHQSEFVQELGAEDAEGAVFLIQLIYLTYYSGLVSVVENNNIVLEKNKFVDDQPLGAKIAVKGTTAVVYLAKVLEEAYGAGMYADLIHLRDFNQFSNADNGVTHTRFESKGIKKYYTDKLLKWKGKLGGWGLTFAAVVAVGLVITAVVLHSLFPKGSAERLAGDIIIAVVATALLVVIPILDMKDLIVSVARIYKITPAQSWAAISRNVENINRGLKSAAVVGLVISVGIALGVFMWAVFQGGIAPGTIAYKVLVAQFLASLVVAVIIFAISLSLVGLIVLGIVTVIDLILLALGSRVSIVGTITKALADLFYTYQLMVKNPQVETGALQLDFVGDGADKGLVAGNPLELSLTISTTITHTVARGSVSLNRGSRFFTKSNLKSTVAVYQLDTEPIEIPKETLERGSMRDSWDPDSLMLLTGSSYEKDRDLDNTPNSYWRGSDVVTPTITLVPEAGINTSLPVYLNSGFALPGVSCKPKDCDLHTLRSRSSTDIGSALVLDVLPATLDGFYALDWGGKRPFYLQRDHDGDGLIAAAYGGNDPNDVIVGCPSGSGPCWDSDGDGYSDRREVALQIEGKRNNPSVKDADSDGICDPEELRLGTDPQKADTDGDGLSDSVETWHYSCTTNKWSGGWSFQADSLAIRMFSDPLVVDADGDGLNDKSEKDLYGSQGVDASGVPYHPSIPNDNPLRLTIDFSDDVVGKNQSFVVTTTVRNDSSQWAYGTVTTNVPAPASNTGAATVSETFPNLNSGGEFYQQVIPLTVPNTASSTTTTFTASAQAGANNGSIEPVWSWASDPSQTTPAYVYGLALADMPAAVANQGGAAFSAASLERPDGVTGYQPYPPLWSMVTANGMNRQIIGNGNYQSSQAINKNNAGNPEYDSNMAVFTPPDVACNDAGDCFNIAVSAYLYNCKQATFNSLNVINQNDGSDGPAGSEFYIVHNGLYWNHTFSGSNGRTLWQPPSAKDGETKTPMSSDPVPASTFWWCEGDTLSLWEDDGNGAKDDEDYGGQSYSPSGLSSQTHTFKYVKSNDVDVELSVTFNSPAQGAVAPQWQAWDNVNCTNIEINSLFVQQSADKNNIGAAAEYYIQHNGPNRGSTSNNNAIGTRLWTAPAGAKTGATLPVNQGVFVCRGDTIDVWEDDPGSKDDFICSIKVLSDSPANPSGDPNKTSEAGYPFTSTALGWVSPSGGVCTNPDTNNEVELSLTVESNAKYVVTAGLFDANGTIKTNGSNQPQDGLVLRPQFWAANAYAKYQIMSEPAVASDGQNFLAVWIRGDGLLEYEFIEPDGRGAGSFVTRSAPVAAADVDLVYVEGGFYLWAMKGVDNKIYLFYTNGRGQQVVGGYQTITTNNAYGIDLAVNPTTRDAMLVYYDAGKINGRLISISNSTNPIIGAPITILNDNGLVQRPEVAYYSANNIWIVAWTRAFTDSGVSYRALRSDGTPFNTAILPIQDIPAIVVDFDLACDQKSSNSSCAIGAYGYPTNATNLRLDTFRAIETPLNFSDFTPTASRTLIIDTAAPTTTLNRPDGDILSLTGNSIVLSGQTTDVESGVASVLISIDNGSFVPVTDGPDANSHKEAWAHLWTSATAGDHIIKVKLKDRADNEATLTFNVTVDNSVPTISSSIANNSRVATTEVDGTWFVTLSGTAQDDSGITAVIATTTQGDVAATLSCSNNDTSCNWTVAYPLPTFDSSTGLTGPSGTYTAQLQAIDKTNKANTLAVTFKVDGAAPIATLLLPDPLAVTQVITPTALAVSGVITDPGDITTGVQSLQVDLFESDSTGAPDWQTAVNATLGSVGANITTWNYTIPTGVEGFYDIVLRGTDGAGNTNNLEANWYSGWQGIIDTKPPTTVVTIEPLINGQDNWYKITATASDAFLTEKGWEFTCDINNLDRTTGIRKTGSGGGSLNTQLLSITVSCIRQLSQGLEFKVFDAYGNKTLVDTPLPQNTLAAQPAFAAAPAASVLASTVLTPTDGIVLTSHDPITITGAAYAADNLNTLALSINGTEVYTESWSTQTITSSLWSTSWTPSADGVYNLVSTATDQNNATQTELLTSTLTIDTQPPTITFDNTVFTEAQLVTTAWMELTGTVSDNLGVTSLLISVDGGPATWVDFDATTWRYVLPINAIDDGQTYGVTLYASDGGNLTTVTETITVDILSPLESALTLKATGGSSAITLAAGDTVRDPQATTRRLEWTASSDGSGIDHYAAQWSPVLTPTVNTMTTYAANGTLAHSETGSEASISFAHLLTVDGAGNSTLQTEGPIYLDAPMTPDYINPADGLTTTIYRGWMESGCSQIGANYEVFRNGLDGTTLTAVQEMYLTWDASNLRLAWTGANWDIDGDLFIYFDTGSGGATTAYDPYSSPLTIDLPAQNASQLAANYLIYIEDGTTATLLAWNGSSWTTAQTLDEPNYFYDDGITDLYLPLSWLGNPTAMKLVALASEEETLHLWATMPDKNPLNSVLATNGDALPFLDTSFSLQQQYEWTNIGSAGVCPAAGQFDNADLTATLTASPTGAQVGYLAQDLAGLLQSSGVPKVQLDSNNNGIADLNEDSNAATYLPLDTNPSPIGPGGTATYTLRVTNDGAAAATGVKVDLAAYGAMSLGSSTNTPVTLGTIAAGSFAEVTFTVNVASSTAIDGGEVTAVISDDIHGAFDWLWVLYDIDHEGPTNVTINGPKYINPGLSQIFGVVSDASDVPTIILERVGGGGTTTCTDSTPADGSWTCVWDASTITSASIDLHAKGIDEWGNAGTFGPAFTFILDDVPPTITLDAASITALSDGLLLGDELLLQGQVSDNNVPAYAKLCGQEASETESTCSLVAVDPSTGRWFGRIPADLAADNKTYTFTFYGIDAAGNESATPLTYSNVQVDAVGPTIDVTTLVKNPSQFVNSTVLAGTAIDGAGVTSMTMWVSKMDATESISLNNILSGANWSYTRAFTELGDYSVSLEATDAHGNVTRIGPIVLTVVTPGTNLPPTLGLGADYTVNEGETIVLDANASDPNGDTLTYAWDVGNDGSVEGTGATFTFDATALDAPATPLSYIVALKVSDGINGPVTASTVVSVANVSPTIANLAATAVSENGTTTLSGTISDPAAADSFTLAVNWGDGSAVQNVSYPAGTMSFSLTHQYLDDNPSGSSVDNVLITLIATDDDGGSTQDSTIVQVSNDPPTLAGVAVTAVNENDTATLSGTITDAGTLDSFTLEVDWGDGSTADIFDYAAGTTSFSETHLYLDDDPSGTAVDDYTVTLILRDDDLGSGEASTIATISNLNPIISSVSSNGPVDEGDNVILTITASDPAGAADPLSYFFDCDNDNSYEVGPQASNSTICPLPKAGTYPVNVRVQDDDGGSATASTVAVVLEPLFLSLDQDGSIGGISFADEDIIKFKPASRTWFMIFDGSDMLINYDLTAFTLLDDGTILMSFENLPVLPGLGQVTRGDVVRFHPASLGDNTSGTFSLLFDASDLGIDKTVDGLGLDPNGRLLLSFDSNVLVNGISSVRDDILTFNADNFGDNTVGTFEMYYRGNDVGMRDRDINALWVDEKNNDMYLSTKNGYTINGISGRERDIIIFTPTATGIPTSGSYNPNLFFVGIDQGLNRNIDGFSRHGQPPPVAGGIISPTERADLMVTMSDSVDPVAEGDSLQLNVVLQNGGPDTAVNGRILVTINPRLKLDSLTIAQGNCDTSAGPGGIVTAINCFLGDVASGAGATLTLHATALQEGVATTSVTVSSDTLDDNLDDNDADETTTITGSGSGGTVIYLTSSNTDTIGGVSYRPEDIFAYYVDGDAWEMVFDGSVHGSTREINAFHIRDDGTILISYKGSTTIPQVGNVRATDIVAFDPSTGTFSMYLLGASVDLNSTSSENIDALFEDSNGDLIISTTGNPVVNGTSLSAQDEDLLKLNRQTGVWELLIDGSDLALPDVTGLWMGNNNDLHLVIDGNVSLGGIPTNRSDIFVVTVTNYGATTAATFGRELFFDGSGVGFNRYINGIDVKQLP